MSGLLFRIWKAWATGRDLDALRLADELYNRIYTHDFTSAVVKGPRP